jgi:hypothetical protein
MSFNCLSPDTRMQGVHHRTQGVRRLSLRVTQKVQGEKNET